MSLFGSKKVAEPMGFCGNVEEYPDLRIFRLKGSIDMSVVPECAKYKKHVQSQPGFEYKSELLDFKSVTFIDSSAIAELVQLVSELKKEHLKLGVINLKDNLRSVLEILKVDQIISEYPSESEAIADLKR